MKENKKEIKAMCLICGREFDKGETCCIGWFPEAYGIL